MDKKIEKILRAFEKRAAKESKPLERLMQGDRSHSVDDFLLPVGPATGQLINLLIKEAGSKVIVEIGSSYGYSTVWLAEAARETGGKVISLEIHEGKQKSVRATVKEAGLAEFVDFKLGDALASLAKLKKPIDFVLLDLWKSLYVPCLEAFYPKLNNGALIAADNMIYPEGARKEAAKYQKVVRAKRGMQSILLNVGSGIELSRYDG